MDLRKLLLLPLLAAALIVTTASGVSAQQKNGSAHSKKPTQPAEYYFVCPMHEDVTSKQRAKCPKCKMNLVKKRKPKTPST